MKLFIKGQDTLSAAAAAAKRVEWVGFRSQYSLSPLFPLGFLPQPDPPWPTNLNIRLTPTAPLPLPPQSFFFQNFLLCFPPPSLSNPCPIHLSPSPTPLRYLFYTNSYSMESWFYCRHIYNEISILFIFFFGKNR